MIQPIIKYDVVFKFHIEKHRTLHLFQTSSSNNEDN